MLVKFSTLAGGVFIEQCAPGPDYPPDARCFRFDREGRAEYAHYADLISGNPAPRWYAHAFRADQFIVA